MTLRALGVVFIGLGLAGLAAHSVTAQALQPGLAGQQVAAQIIPADQEDEFVKGAVKSGTPGLVAPRLLKQSDPKYTAETLRAKLEGTVKLEAVVGVDGVIERSRVKESLDPVLDAQALKALAEWQFAPGTLKGVPARVLIDVEMMFRVHR